MNSSCLVFRVLGGMSRRSYQVSTPFATSLPLSQSLHPLAASMPSTPNSAVQAANPAQPQIGPDRHGVAATGCKSTGSRTSPSRRPCRTPLPCRHGGRSAMPNSARSARASQRQAANPHREMEFAQPEPQLPVKLTEAGVDMLGSLDAPPLVHPCIEFHRPPLAAAPRPALCPQHAVHAELRRPVGMGLAATRWRLEGLAIRRLTVSRTRLWSPLKSTLRVSTISLKVYFGFKVFGV